MHCIALVKKIYISLKSQRVSHCYELCKISCKSNNILISSENAFSKDSKNTITLLLFILLTTSIYADTTSQAPSASAKTLFFKLFLLALAIDTPFVKYITNTKLTKAIYNCSSDEFCGIRLCSHIFPNSTVKI